MAHCERVAQLPLKIERTQVDHPEEMTREMRGLEAMIARRFLPFAAVGLLGLVVAALPPQPTSWTPAAMAAVLVLAISAAGMILPWSRLPRWTYVLPPLAYFAVVLLLRQASHGSAFEYAPLAILPVVWVALNLGRIEVGVAIAAGAAIFVVPLVLDPDLNAAGEWRRALLWTSVAAIIGYAIEDLVREKRMQTRRAREQGQTIAAIADVSRELTSEEDPRARICQATLEIADARSAALWEPDGTGDLVLTGIAGPDVSRERFHIGAEPSGTVRAYSTGARYFVPDAVGDTTISQSDVQEVGVVSVLFEPIVRSGETIGVLTVGWDYRISDLDDRTAQAVMLLSLEAAAAIERADLVSRLSGLAETDELTGLPNRRSWDETIRRAVGYAGRTGRSLCVALIDLDRFKEYNDLRGHQAGDVLLVAAATAWRTALRETDTLARYGGEEFAVVLPGCTALDAQVVLERVRALTPDGQTCSVGLAEWSSGETPAELLTRADAALYAAKRGGRDTLVAAA